MKRLIICLAVWLCAAQCFAAWTERYVTTAGAGTHAGTSEANAFTLAEAITDSATAADGTRFNVKSDATYTLAGDINFNGAGSSGGAIWWRGYDSTIGDIDADNTLEKPLIDDSTNFTTVSGAFQWFSQMRFTGASVTANEGVVRCTGPDCRFWRCRFTGTAADVDCRAVSSANTCDRTLFVACYFSANALASCVTSADVMLFHGCVFSGGLTGITTTGGECFAGGSLFIKHAGDGINHNTGTAFKVINCSFYNQGSDCIEIVAAANTALVVNSIFQDAAGAAVNSSAAASAAVTLFNNSFFSNTADLTNIHESYQVGNVTESSSPFTNAAGGDFTIVDGALSIGTGYPGELENSTGNIGYPDIGALQREEPAPGGSNTVDPFSATIPGL
jgi:hypothetical protein